MLKAQSSVRRVASAPMPCPRRPPSMMPAGAPEPVADLQQPGPSDRLEIAAVIDGEVRLRRLATGAGLGRPLKPLGFGLLGVDRHVDHATAHVQLVDPARIARHEIAAQRAKRSTVARKKQLRVTRRNIARGYARATKGKRMTA